MPNEITFKATVFFYSHQNKRWLQFVFAGGRYNCFFIPVFIDDDVLKMLRLPCYIPVAGGEVQLSPANFAKGLFLAAPFPF